MDGEFWYRYEDRRYSAGVNEYEESLGTIIKVELRTYQVVSTTPKGVWLRPWYGTFRGSDKHFVLRDARKRYACPTKEEAKESFLARKNRQIRILSAQLQHAREAVNIINGGHGDFVWFMVHHRIRPRRRRFPLPGLRLGGGRLRGGGGRLLIVADDGCRGADSGTHG